ncbi:hypothetical protein ACJJTC_006834 [Scirpophaga incertulas]
MKGEGDIAPGEWKLTRPHEMTKTLNMLHPASTFYHNTLTERDGPIKIPRNRKMGGFLLALSDFNCPSPKGTLIIITRCGLEARLELRAPQGRPDEDYACIN